MNKVDKLIELATDSYFSIDTDDYEIQLLQENINKLNLYKVLLMKEQSC